MGRNVRGLLGGLFGLALLATPAAAQVHVDVGVMTPNVGARVVVGAPRVIVVDPYADPYAYGYYGPQPVYAPAYRYTRGRTVRGREFRQDMRKARREYVRDRREAVRDYRRDIRDARRDYDRAQRNAWRGRR